MKAAILSASLLVAGCVDNQPDDHTGTITEDITQVCGVGPTVEGVDVADYQGAINWTAAKAAGVVYSFVRVSDGLNSLDSDFASNWSGTRSAGVYHGAYQYFEPGQDAVSQANLLLSKMGTFEADDLPPVIDVETATGSTSATDLHNKVQTWINTVQAAIGRPPIIYVGAYFWDDNVGGANDNADPLWHAQYTSATCPTIADPWPTWAFWQYTDSGSISGISGAVDVDRWNGDLASLQAFLGPAGTCGDGTCNANEDSWSCPEDCGPCGTVDPVDGFAIDDGDACFEGGGPSAYLRDVTGTGYENDLIWTHTTDDATEANYATWHLYFAGAGTYKVEVYTAASYAQSKQAKYVITGAGSATHTVTVDQTAVDGWQTLGEFAFDAGGHQAVHVGDNTGEPGADDVQLVLDGVRITPAGAGSGGSTGSDGSGSTGSGDGGSGVLGPGASPEGSDGSEPGSSGCNTGASPSALLGLAFAGLLRRRRR